MFMKANGKKLYEEVAGQIKHLIETKQLNSGDMLPSEEEMSKSIGVGRSTVREALRSLELIGLVETKRGRGTFVKTADVNAFNDMLLDSVKLLDVDSYHVYEIDRLLEPNAARLLAQRAKDEDIEMLESILQKMDESLKNGGSGDVESLAFHKAIFSALENPFLDIIFDLTKNVHQKDRKAIFNVTDRARKTYEEHYKIFEAIKSRDGAKAYRYMEKHLSKVGDVYDKVFSFKYSGEIDREKE
jgi:GntR family transcriptional repressor for pyruvate dehydrogenase complex